jgi:protein phosphatase 2C family protein 2/3
LIFINAHKLLDLKSSNEALHFFAIYDGHWGDQCAKFVSKTLYKNVVDEIKQRLHNKDIAFVLEKYARSIYQEAFQKTDQEYKPNAKDDLTGSTACFVTIVNNQTTKTTDIFCANIGDSRCVLFDGGRVAPLSFDHKPFSKKEKQRIISAGGTVEHGRVNGDLSLARAFGDFYYKSNQELSVTQQQVICIPDMIHMSLPSSNVRRFLIVACDGVFDVLSSDEAANFVNERLNKDMSLEDICKQLVIHCAKDLKCLDNISAIIVVLNPIM